MSWQLLLAISVLTYSISVLLQRVLLKDKQSDPVAYTIVFQLLNGVVIGVFALINGFKIPADVRPILGNLLLMIVFYGLANVFIFKSLKETEASEFTILFATRALWSIFAAVLFLGESLSTGNIIGTFLILASVIFVSWKSTTFQFGRGELLALAAAALFGLAFTNDAFIIRGFDVPSYLSIAFILPALSVWILNPKATGKMKLFLNKQILSKMIILALFYSVSAITVFEAYQVGRNAVQIAPLNQTTIIVTVVLAVIFLKEKTQLARKVLGSLISFIGVLFLR